MIARFFHAWERRLASVTKDRLVRPFEWGLDWIDANGQSRGAPPEAILLDWVSHALADSPRFFDTPISDDYTFTPAEAGGTAGALSFPSALRTPHPENNIVRARYFRTQNTAKGRRAVVVLPQWNADADGHVGLCHLLNKFGLSALRMSLPYHDARKPPELNRADYIVSSNIARTVQVCRQAVMDARRAVAWLQTQGYERIGILGTSLGSCLSLLTAAHEPLIRAQALNHISPYFADVVWRGLSTLHVRAGLNGHIDLDTLRRMWLPISPQAYLDRVTDKKTLLVYAKYDLTFPVDLSESLVGEFQRRGIPHEVAVLPCGHYSTGVAPFKYLDGFVLARFLDRNL
ncbi:MAG: alpha/beta hydrolase family protein [Vicinamibacterales bacterium]|nr:alpha/beta hydrolase family protein [Vicinamibacterales bacterium]